MDYVVILFAVVALGAVAAMVRWLWSLEGRIGGWVQDAIAGEVRLQDDRLRKRMERSDRTEQDPDRTEDGQEAMMPGRPYRR